jgi:CRISPR-associated protein Csm5
MSSLKIYLLRVASLQLRGHDHFELGWKQSPRGTADGKRPDEGTPFFAEMASPGTVFEGRWQERSFLTHPAVTRSLRWKEAVSRDRIFQAANEHAASQLALHKEFADRAALPLLAQNLDHVQARLNEVHERGDACLLSLGWGSGLLGKIAWLRTQDETYREIIRQTPVYGKSIHPALPFPKTRRIVFLGNQPATLPGWVLLEVAGT